MPPGFCKDTRKNAFRVVRVTRGPAVPKSRKGFRRLNPVTLSHHKENVPSLQEVKHCKGWKIQLCYIWRQKAILCSAPVISPCLSSAKSTCAATQVLSRKGGEPALPLEATAQMPRAPLARQKAMRLRGMPSHAILFYGAQKRNMSKVPSNGAASHMHLF